MGDAHESYRARCRGCVTSPAIETLARVRTEMSLHVLAYNLKRVMRILGIAAMMQADEYLRRLTA